MKPSILMVLGAALSFTAEGQDRESNPEYVMKLTSMAAHASQKDFKTPSWGSLPASVSYSLWVNSGEPFDCSEPMPPAGLVDYGDRFTQNYSCYQAQTRTRTSTLSSIELGVTRPAPVVAETQELTVVFSKDAVGTRNYIIEQVYSPYSTWVQTATSGCGEWSPSVDEVSLNAEFTQSRSCSGTFSRERDVYDLYADSTETFLEVESESKIEQITETQQAIGTKNERVFVRNYDESEFYSSASSSCASYSPSRSSVRYGEGFRQARGCNYRNYYTVTTYAEYSDGTREYVSDRMELVTGSYYTQRRDTTGTKDYVVSSAWTAWEWEYSCSYVGTNQIQFRKLMATYASGAKRQIDYDYRTRQSTGC